MKRLIWMMIIGGLLLIALYCLYIIKRMLNFLFPKKSRKMKNLILLGIVAVVAALCLFVPYGPPFFLYAGLVALLTEPVHLVIYLICKRKPPKFWNVIYRLCLPAVLLGLVLCVYGAWNIRTIRRTEYTVTSKDIDREMTILLVSDFHYGTAQSAETLKNAAAKMNDEHADLLIIAGDLTDEQTSAEEMHEVVEILGTVSAQNRIYVFGNHDLSPYSSKEPAFSKEELVTALKNAGITVLEDETLRISDSVTVFGRKDRSSIREQYSQSEPFAGNEYVISVDHQPSEFVKADEAGVDLLLSGHTHSGQMFPLGWMITLTMDSDLLYGRKTMSGGMEAIVTSGISGWGFPVRTEGISEYVVIHVQPAK